MIPEGNPCMNNILFNRPATPRPGPAARAGRRGGRTWGWGPRIPNTIYYNII